MQQQVHEKFQNVKARPRIRGICDCCLSSAPCRNNWIQPGKLHKLGLTDGQSQQSRHAIVIRSQVDYKSEEYDITGTELDSIVSSELLREAISVEGMREMKPWWEQFPKRWVIVLLCFTAFLLCNMDRVNMSIAILPMSKECNWDNATVG